MLNFPPVISRFSTTQSNNERMLRNVQQNQEQYSIILAAEENKSTEDKELKHCALYSFLV